MTEQTYTIRPARPDDARALLDIYNPYVAQTCISFETDPVDEAEMRRRIATLAGRYPFLVAEAGGHVAGFCYAHPWKERPAYARTLETTIYLAPRSQRGGLGTRLMEALIAECRELGAHALVACITADNEASLAFHRRLGFRQVSLFSEVGRKFGRWLDVADLELRL